MSIFFFRCSQASRRSPGAAWSRLGFFAALLLLSVGVAGDALAETSIERGRYLSIIAGCNECHTSGYSASGGKVPESEWLKGDSIGFNGPWGTTYPINLRKFMATLTPEAWIAFARASRSRPPMPSYILHTMTDTDLRALYDFIRSLGDAGELMPVAVPPGVEPKTPYFDFVPKNLPGGK